MPDIVHEDPAYDPMEADVIWINFVVDSLYFKRNNMVQELEQLHREYLQMHDILCCSSWYTQFKAEIFEEEFKKDFEQARGEVLREGLGESLEILRDLLVSAVQMRFPELEALTVIYVQSNQGQSLLHDMIKQVWSATDIEQARKLLQL
jgi:hypothetical protein